MAGKLAGKVAVVTGASKGIGAAIAKRLAADGAAVVVNYASSKSGADQVVSQIAAGGGKAVAIQADLSQEADAVRLFQETDKAFGRLDILVNNAGVYEFASLEGITAEHFHRQFNLNVLGLLFATREAAKHMTSGGNIINISSAITRLPTPGAAVYAGTKGAVDVMTYALARELAPRKIRVNVVNPGMIETEGVRSGGFVDGDLRKHVEATALVPRIGQPDDIAPIVSFLVSDEASYIAGEQFVVAGGLR